MTHTQTANTDALRKLWQAASVSNTPGQIDDGARLAFNSTLANALPAILDEIDRLRAAETASKARAKKEPELCVKCHGNGTTRLPNGVEWCDRCGGSCWEPARAEIAHLTDAAPTFADAVAVVRRWRDKWAETYTDRNDEFAGTERVAAETIIRDLEALASEKRSPPPAAADRGVPEPRVSDEDIKFYARDAITYEPHLTLVNKMARDLRDCRAALATAPKAEFCPHCGIADYDRNCGHPGDGCLENGTAQAIEAYKAQAPKAEDVRQEAIEECAVAAQESGATVSRDDFVLLGPSVYLRAAVNAIRALANRPAQ